MSTDETTWEGKYDEPTPTNYVLTPIKVAIHPSGKHPECDSSFSPTYLSVKDEGGGSYIVIEQPENSWGPGGEIRLMLEEIEFISCAARNLLKTYESKEGITVDEIEFISLAARNLFKTYESKEGIKNE